MLTSRVSERHEIRSLSAQLLVRWVLVTEALGIRVAGDLLDRWHEWFGPQLQPFNTARLGVGAPGVGRPAKPTLELRDTFDVYSDDDWTWLEEAEFADLDLKTRRALLHGRAATGLLGDIPDHLRSGAAPQGTDSQIVWWPPLLRTVGDDPLLRYVENGLPHSRHREVTSKTWARAGRILTGAADLAGRFPTSSGPNCFASVLAAAGVGDGSEWVQREPFEEWLTARTAPIRGKARDHLAGVVLVWRTHDGLAEHAAVTIGDGYTFNKPSQGWFSPRLVWTVQETITASRYKGVTLSRYLIAS